MNLDKVSPERLNDLFNQFNEYPQAEYSQLQRVGIADVDWTDYSTMKELTCINHLWSRYLTKNPWTRSIFCIQGPHGINADIDDACDCPFQNLRVVIGALD